MSRRSRGCAIRQTNTLSTGDALTSVANITPVGNGPFGVRPRLRGLDSTRLLVLVDGERLNTARQATDRTGAEVGLISPDAISRMEIVNGAGTLLYGSDALAGTINIITNEPAFSQAPRWLYGFNGFYSSNEQGRRGTGPSAMTPRRGTPSAFRRAGGVRQLRGRQLHVEDTRPLFASRRSSNRRDTIDDNFGFAFNAFPGSVQRPVRADRATRFPTRGEGHVRQRVEPGAAGEERTLRIRYQRRRMDDIGFPDFAGPTSSMRTSLPHSNLDRRLGALRGAGGHAVAGQPLARRRTTSEPSVCCRTTCRCSFRRRPRWRSSRSASSGWTSCRRPNSASGRRASTSRPFVPVANHVLTTGLTFYRDRSRDARDHHHDHVDGRAGGARPARSRAGRSFPSPIQLGPPSVAHPVRVPDASLRDVAVFAQDEWRLRPNTVAGRRGFAATSTASRPRRRPATTWRRSWPARGRRSTRHAAGPERRHVHAERAHRRRRRSSPTPAVA